MKRFFFLYLCCVVFINNQPLAQCPEKEVVWKRINFLKQQTSISATEQLNELLKLDEQIKKCPAGNDTVYALLLLRIGVLYYGMQDYESAVKFTRRSVQVLHANDGNSLLKKKYLPKVYYNLQIYYDSLKLFSQKYEAIDSCITIESALNTGYYYTLILLTEKVKYLFFKGDYALCLKYASFGESLVPMYYHEKDSMDYIIFFITYQANALYTLNNFDLAENLLNNKKDKFLKENNRYYLSIIYGLLGFINKEKANYRQAVYYFREAYRLNSISDKKEIRALSLFQAGAIFSEKLNWIDSAFIYYKKGLLYANNIDSLRIYAGIANLYVKEKKFDTAFLFFQKSFDKIKPGINENDLLLHVEEYVDANAAEYVMNVVLDKADARLKQYLFTKDKDVLAKSVSVYKVADILLTRIKAGQAEMTSRLLWRNFTRRLYEHAIEASFLQDNNADAFYFFEKSRAVLLNDQLNEQNMLSQDDMLKQAQLKKKLLYLSQQQNGMEITSAAYKKLQAEIFHSDEDLNRLEKSLRDKNPLYYQRFSDTSFITLNIVREKLFKDHTALVEIFNGDSAVYLLMITSDVSKISKIDKHDFDKTAEEYISFISSRDNINRNMDGYVKTASHLYGLMFRESPPPAGRVIISPDGRYFPFEALVTESNTKRPAYFLNNYTVSYTYSARYLMNEFVSDKKNLAGNFFGLAPVQYPAKFGLAALQGSDPSLTRIASFLGDGNNLIATQASRSNFMKQFAGYTIVQLYTHAADSSDRREPVIYFADSALYLSELIAENKPVTKLIVLSACETGNGNVYRGEGVFSFNRAFAALGIPSSVTNLWSVDNESTYQLTELFYKHLSKGLPLDVAMQKAKKEFIEINSKEKSLPYYWAAAILVGKTDPVVYEKPFLWKYLVVAFGILGLVYFGWRLRKNYG